MTERTTFDAAIGEALNNTHWDDKFTCPNCLEDHVHTVREEASKLIDCTCGARLRLELKLVPEAVCTVVDPDEEAEEDD